MWFPGGSAVKNLPANAGDVVSIPGLGRSPRGLNGNLLQYSCGENPMDRGPWQAILHGGHKESDMTEHAQIAFSLPQPLTNCITLSKLLNFSEPIFSFAK